MAEILEVANNPNLNKNRGTVARCEAIDDSNST